MKAVTFDLWNTLISEKDYTSIRMRHLMNILEEQGITRSIEEAREAYRSALDRTRRVWETENYRHVPLEESIDHMLEKISVNLPRTAKTALIKGFAEAVLEDPPSLREGAKETLEALKPRYGIGIISDTGITPGSILRTILRENGVLSLFNTTVFSDEVGFCKPHEITFRTALRELGADPSEAAHVGDLLETDVAGARAMGMKAVWLKLREGAQPGRYIPDYEIKTLPQVVAILNEIHGQ